MENLTETVDDWGYPYVSDTSISVILFFVNHDSRWDVFDIKEQ